MWDYFENVIPILEKKYHLIVPALPGYDPDKNDDLTGVEEIAADLETWLIAHGYCDISCLYGCSMGGSIVIRMLADHQIRIRNAVIDGGITPYQFPYLITRCIAVRVFLMIYMGKLGGIRLLTKAFAADDYSEDDLSSMNSNIQYLGVLKHDIFAELKACLKQATRIKRKYIKWL
jgi:pimeloyl-ACP methyl ester carboxylesterase